MSIDILNSSPLEGWWQGCVVPGAAACCAFVFSNYSPTALPADAFSDAAHAVQLENHATLEHHDDLLHLAQAASTGSVGSASAGSSLVCPKPSLVVQRSKANDDTKPVIKAKAPSKFHTYSADFVQQEERRIAATGLFPARVTYGAGVPQPSSRITLCERGEPMCGCEFFPFRYKQGKVLTKDDVAELEFFGRIKYLLRRIKTKHRPTFIARGCICVGGGGVCGYMAVLPVHWIWKALLLPGRRRLLEHREKERLMQRRKKVLHNTTFVTAQDADNFHLVHGIYVAVQDPIGDEAHTSEGDERRFTEVPADQAD